MMAAPGSFTAGAVLTAAEMNALPGGIVVATAGGTGGYGYIASTTSATLTTSEADVSGATVTFTADSNRIYKFTFYGLLQDQGNVYININGTNEQRGRNDAGGFVSVTASIIKTGLSGSIVAKLRGDASTGTAILSGASGRPYTFYVEDIGGS